MLEDDYDSAFRYTGRPPAALLVEGHFARHIRRTRMLYAERQAALVTAAGRDLAGLLDVRPKEAGLHLVGWLPAGVDDRAAATQATRLGVDACR